MSGLAESVVSAGKDTGNLQWLGMLRAYLLVTVAANLVWEFAHMPLYTLWDTGTGGEILFAAVHCTGGDLLIASATLLFSLLAFGKACWPERAFYRVAASTMILGVGYTVFSEWLNIVIRKSWEYSDAMPMVPWTGMGLSPLLQWIFVPALAFWWGRRFAGKTVESTVH